MTPQQIRILRESLGLTQEEFAKRIGAGRVTVTRWELGLSKPTGLYLKALEKLRSQTKSKSK